MDSTLRLDSSIASRHRIYSLSVPSGALPLVSHTECHLTLTPEVHTLLYQTLGLTLYFCLYFSGLDSSTGLLYSKQTSYLLSFSPFRCSTSCLPHGVPSDDSTSVDSVMSTLQLLRYAAFFQDFVIMNFQFFRCTLLNHDSLNSSNKYSSTPPLRLWYVCVLFVLLCMLVHGCPFGRVWEGPAFVIIYSVIHLINIDSSTGLLYSNQPS